MLPFFIIVSLIFICGLFVAAEFSIVSVPRATIEQLAKTNRIARIIQGIHHEPKLMDQYIATAQVGITLASLGLGMYGEHLLAETVACWLIIIGIPGWFSVHAISSVLAVAFLTYFHIVLGEMLPKSIALQKPEKIALFVTPIVIFMKYLFYPLVIIMNLLGNRIIKLMGINRQAAGEQQYHTTEELEFIVKESQEGGLLRAEAGRVLRELFEFGDLTAGQVMVPRVKIIGIPVDISEEELRGFVAKSLHTRYPVYKGDLDHILGIIHIKDVLDRLNKGLPLKPEVTHSVPYVPETATLDIIFTVMKKAKTQIAIVMDEYGGTAGLVTIEDLFEEVVGDINEGTGSKNIFSDKSGKLHVAGTVRLDELGEKLNMVLEHEEVDTISGLVLSMLGRPPKIGDIVVYRGIRLEVNAVEGHGVKECLARTATSKFDMRDFKGGKK